MSAGWKADLSDRIMRLTRLRDQLDSCIGCGCLSLGVCPSEIPGTSCRSWVPGRSCLIPNVAIDRELTLAAVECSLARFTADGYIPVGNPVKIVRRVAARTVKNVERLGN